MPPVTPVTPFRTLIPCGNSKRGKGPTFFGRGVSLFDFCDTSIPYDKAAAGRLHLRWALHVLPGDSLEEQGGQL